MKNILLLLGLVLFLLPNWLLNTGCAKIIAPTGGEKDTIAPKIVLEKSTPNLQTNFRPLKISLTFDEWVQLNQPTQQVVVSPPLSKSPNIALLGKTVTLDLSEETLRENATYTINFGEAVQDYTERNSAKNLRFVFSTGNYIDSLTVGGRVTNNSTGTAAKDVLVMLYDNLNDTVVRTERPFYFAKTDKDGRFLVQNVRSGTFKIFALIDENFNYRYDTEAEQIGFLFKNITVSGSDSVAPDVALSVFLPNPMLRRTASLTKEYGHLRLAYNQPLYDSLFVRAEPSFPTDYIEQSKDTLHFWYADTTTSRILYVNDGKEYFDTVRVNLPKSANFYKKNKKTNLQLPEGKKRKTTILQNPHQPLELVFKHPFYDIDTAKWLLTEDTLQKRVKPYFQRFGSSMKNLAVHYPWREGMPYQLTLLPGAVKDVFGLENDTIVLDYTVDAAKNYGNIEVVVTGLSKDSSYVVQLLNAQDKVVETIVVNNETEIRQKYKALPTGNYKLKWIEDINGNGRWDTGKYPNRYPEKIKIGASEELRPNWDLELILAI